MTDVMEKNVYLSQNNDNSYSIGLLLENKWEFTNFWHEKHQDESGTSYIKKVITSSKRQAPEETVKDNIPNDSVSSITYNLALEFATEKANYLKRTLVDRVK